MAADKYYRIMVLFCAAFFSIVESAYTQQTFEVIANVDEGVGKASESVVAPDGTIFLANKQDGLRAYIYNGSSFENIAHIDDGGQANGLVLAADGTIFLANGLDGLRAYTFDGSIFTNIAHIDSGG